MKQLSSLYQHRYMGPDDVTNLRCATCIHWFDAARRCSLIAAEEGPVHANDCCRYWFDPEILAKVYPASEPKDAKRIQRRPTMRPPDLGRLLTKAEAAFTEDVDESVLGCGDCQFFVEPRTCTLIGPDTVEARGGCSAFWRNVRKEADDERLHAEFKAPPPEMTESAVEDPTVPRPWWRRLFTRI